MYIWVYNQVHCKKVLGCRGQEVSLFHPHPGCRRGICRTHPTRTSGGRCRVGISIQKALRASEADVWRSLPPIPRTSSPRGWSRPSLLRFSEGPQSGPRGRDLNRRSLLDTNIVSAPIAPVPNVAVIRRLERKSERCVIASPVWHELLFGCFRLAPGRRRSALEEYLQEVVRPTFPILPCDESVAVNTPKCVFSSNPRDDRCRSRIARLRPSPCLTASSS